MRRNVPPNAHTGKSDTWRDFRRALATCLTVVTMVLPPGELVIVAGDVAPQPRVWTRGVPAHPWEASAFRFESQPVADDEGLEGGPDDDDFRPSPDRARAASARNTGCASPLSFVSVALPRPVGGPDQPSAGAGRPTSPARAGVCPALDTTIQFLC